MCWMAFTVEGKITCVRFPSRLNVAFGNALVLMPQGSLKGARFFSWCNVFLGNGIDSQSNVTFGVKHVTYRVCCLDVGQRSLLVWFS